MRDLGPEQDKWADHKPGLHAMQKKRFQMLNDEIVTSVQEFNPVDDETDEDNNESSKCPSNANVVFALETATE
ncbi:hypothetical protein TNCV_189101 [Trichonephila clavipes]|nr:hypothetical protein TNCV_189101 [Trichonephila clavipes]